MVRRARFKHTPSALGIHIDLPELRCPLRAGGSTPYREIWRRGETRCAVRSEAQVIAQSMLVAQKPALALDAATVARERTIGANYAVTWYDDPDRV